MKIMNGIRKALLVAIGLLALASCGNNRQWHETQGKIWATTYHITYRAERQMDDSILAVMNDVEMSLSPFKPDSRVSLINRNETAVTDSLFRQVFTTSQRINAASGGMFDPTVAPAVNLWRFGYSDAGREPTDAEIEAVRDIVGIADCRIVGDSIVKKTAATEFNFSAITKGYGCDLIGDMLRRNGCNDYMIEIGGEIALSGENRHDEPWHIMIEAPIDNDSTVSHSRMAVVEITDCGIATSGNYRNYRDTPQGRIGHTINPLTCRPAASTVLSATVIARDAMTADALATACMAMRPAEAQQMIEQWSGAEAMLVEADSTSGWRITTTTNFPR